MSEIGNSAEIGDSAKVGGSAAFLHFAADMRQKGLLPCDGHDIADMQVRRIAGESLGFPSVGFLIPGGSCICMLMTEGSSVGMLMTEGSCIRMLMTVGILHSHANDRGNSCWQSFERGNI